MAAPAVLVDGLDALPLLDAAPLHLHFTQARHRVQQAVHARWSPVARLSDVKPLMAGQALIRTDVEFQVLLNGA